MPSSKPKYKRLPQADLTDEDQTVYSRGDNTAEGQTNNNVKVGKSNDKEQCCGGVYLRTYALCAGFLGLGVCIAMVGPTLLDLAGNVHVDIAHISYIFTARSVGYLVGSAIGGFLFDMFDQHLMLGFSLLLNAIGFAVIPWAKRLSVMGVLISLTGIAMGFLDTGGNVLCLNLWGQRSAPYMQALHFSFGLGALIAPLLAKNFIGMSSSNATLVINTTMPPSLPTTAAAGPHKRDVLSLFGADKLESVHDKQRQWDSEQQNRRTPFLTYGGNNKDKGPVSERTSNVFSATNHATYQSLEGKKSDDENVRSKEEHEAFIRWTKRWKGFKHENDVEMSSNSVFTVETMASGGGTSHVRRRDLKDSPGDVGSGETEDGTGGEAGGETQTGGGSKGGQHHHQHHHRPHKVKGEKPTDKQEPSTRQPLSTKQQVREATKRDTSSSSEQNVTYTESASVPDKIKEAYTKGKELVRSLMSQLSPIRWVYLIVAVYQLLVGVTFVVFYCTSSYKFLGGQQVPPGATEPDKAFTVKVLGLLFLFFFIYVGVEVTYGSFIFSFGTKSKLQLSKDDAVGLNTLFWGTFSLVRGTAIFTTKCLSVKVILLLNLVGAVVSSLGLCVYAEQNRTLLFVATGIFGGSISTIFPSAVSWAERYIHVSGKAAAVFVVGAAFGEMSVPLVVGYLFERNPMWLMYFSLGGSVVANVLFIALQWLVSSRGEKYTLPPPNFLWTEDEDDDKMDVIEMTPVQIVEEGETPLQKITEQLRATPAGKILKGKGGKKD